MLELRGHDEHELYAFSSILCGLVFFVIGGHVWGGNDLIGLAFLLASPLFALFAHDAPLRLGILWAGAMLARGGHYHFRARRVVG